MKQSLQLRLGQHLTMTPQLQQAIRLLQLSTMELQTEIQQALESNPMLEVSEDGEGDGANAVAEAVGINSQATSTPSGEAEPESNFETRDDSVDMRNEDIPQELAVDSNWEDSFDLGTSTTSYSGGDDSGREFEDRDTEEDTLREHLLWQMRLTPFSEQDMAIAEAIIDAVDENGYLATNVEDIWESMREDYPIDKEEVDAVLHRVQNFDPPGVAARDLRECLRIQLKQLEAETPWLKEAVGLIDNHFDLLANREFAQLLRRMKLNDEQLAEVMKLVHSLNPRPGSHVAASHPEYIIPDVYVRKIRGVWRVDLNPDAMPKLSINSLYSGMIQRADKSADNAYMQGQLQEARWLIKSLQSRNETLLKVAKCIVDRQRGFLEHGEEAMKALVLHDVAETVSMHESTISRITNKKYMHTPRGIFELKYFFSSHVSTSSGGECSSTAIRALIKKLVAAEDARRPLSDSKIAKILCDQGINVARRTVAKYRDALNIQPSNERKRLA